jgi:hypothetical protein
MARRQPFARIDFSGVANSPAFSRVPLRPISKIYELQLTDPTFANEFVGQKIVFFQILERAMGIEPTTYSLGS